MGTMQYANIGEAIPKLPQTTFFVKWCKLLSFHVKSAFSSIKIL